MKNDRDLYFQSEKTGYSHLYTVSFEGGEPQALTSGNWEVVRVSLSKDKSRFFLTTSENDPGQHQVYEMSADGGRENAAHRLARADTLAYRPRTIAGSPIFILISTSRPSCMCRKPNRTPRRKSSPRRPRLISGSIRGWTRRS
jgi:hypothetical protein